MKGCSIHFNLFPLIIPGPHRRIIDHTQVSKLRITNEAWHATICHRISDSGSDEFSRVTLCTDFHGAPSACFTMGAQFTVQWRVIIQFVRSKLSPKHKVHCYRVAGTNFAVGNSQASQQRKISLWSLYTRANSFYWGRQTFTLFVFRERKDIQKNFFDDEMIQMGSRWRTPHPQTTSCSFIILS